MNTEVESAVFLILTCCDVSTLRNCIMVCKYWSLVISSDLFWFQICRVKKIYDSVVDQNEALPLGFDLSTISFRLDPNYYYPKPKNKGSSWKEIFFLNFCPHLLSLMEIQNLEFIWNEECKRKIINQKCFDCNELDIWMCLRTKCNFCGCGRTKNGHFIQHSKSTNHSVCIHLREMDVWCYKCDRHLGENDSLEEEINLVRSIRQKLWMPSKLSSHRSVLWNDLL